MVKDMEKIRVLQVILSLGTGGAERLVIDIAKNFDKSRFEVVIVSLFPFENRSFELEAQQKGLRIVYLNCKKGKVLSYIKTMLELMSIMKSFRPHVVHSHLKTLPFLFSSYLFIKVPAKLHTIHNVAHVDASGLTRFVNMLCFCFLKVVPVSISKQVESTVREVYGKNINSPTVYNGIDLEKFQKNRRACATDKNKTIIVNVARFVAQKNHHLLIEAFERVVNMAKTERINVELWLIGDGPLRESIENLVKEKGLNKQVKFLGTRTDVSKILNQCDIFVLSSDYEGFAITLIEALACGLPAVATSVGVIPEVLENGKTGFFVPPGDVEGLSAALFDLVKNEGKRKLFSDQAEKVAQRFDIKTTAREYENLYLSLLKGQ